MDGWQSIGEHFVRVEEDTLLICFVGDMSLAETRAITVIQEEILAKNGHLFAITNLDKAGRFSPEGRRHLAAWNKKFAVSGVAQYGGSRVAQVMAILMLGAIRAFGGNVPEMKYVNSEDEGRAWIAAQRRKLGLAPK